MPQAALGLTLDYPDYGSPNWYSLFVDLMTTLSQHDHTGSGNGVQITAAALAANSISGTAFNLGNNTFLRGRNNANAADVNIIKVRTDDTLELGGTLHTLALTTDLAVVHGGTGASDASGARTNLGLGSIATQASSSVSISGGTLSGVTISSATLGGTLSSSNVTSCVVTNTLQFSDTGASTAHIRSNTSDGSDNNFVALSGGGGQGGTRGAGLFMYGNEHATHPGTLYLHSGEGSTNAVRVYAGGSDVWRFELGGFIPHTDNNQDIGSGSKYVKNIYCKGQLVMNATQAYKFVGSYGARDITPGQTVNSLAQILDTLLKDLYNLGILKQYT